MSPAGSRRVACGIEVTHEIDGSSIELRSEIGRLDGKIQLILIVGSLGVPAPAMTRLVLGS